MKALLLMQGQSRLIDIPECYNAMQVHRKAAVELSSIKYLEEGPELEVGEVTFQDTIWFVATYPKGAAAARKTIVPPMSSYFNIINATF